MQLGRLIIAAAFAATSGNVAAADAEIIQVSPGVYMSIAKNRAGAFGQPSTTKKKAITAANEFANQQGMEAVPVAMEYTEAAPGRWPAAEYQFRLEPKGSGATVGLRRDADVRVEISGDSGPDAPRASGSDLYTELMKLDDLRKRGLLTDQEFETQKAKLLSR